MADQLEGLYFARERYVYRQRFPDKQHVWDHHDDLYRDVRDKIKAHLDVIRGRGVTIGDTLDELVFDLEVEFWLDQLKKPKRLGREASCATTEIDSPDGGDYDGAMLSQIE